MITTSLSCLIVHLAQIPDKQLDMKPSERQPPAPEPALTTPSTPNETPFESDVENVDEDAEERSRPQGNIPIRRRLSTFEDAEAVLSDAQTACLHPNKNASQNQNRAIHRSSPS
jgi:hypothetical protein